MQNVCSSSQIPVLDFYITSFLFQYEQIMSQTVWYKLQQKVQTFTLSKLEDKIKAKQTKLKELRW